MGGSVPGHWTGEPDGAGALVSNRKEMRDRKEWAAGDVCFNGDLT